MPHLRPNISELLESDYIQRYLKFDNEDVKKSPLVKNILKFNHDNLIGLYIGAKAHFYNRSEFIDM